MSTVPLDTPPFRTACSLFAPQERLDPPRQDEGHPHSVDLVEERHATVRKGAAMYLEVTTRETSGLGTRGRLGP